MGGWDNTSLSSAECKFRFLMRSSSLQLEKVSGKGKQSEFYQAVHEVPENICKLSCTVSYECIRVRF
jgi:hypothetical protein